MRKEEKKNVEKAFYENFGTYGRRRLRIYLKNRGIKMSENKISKILKELKLEARYKRNKIKNIHTSNNTKEYRAENKLNHLSKNERDQEIWSIDFTEEKIANKKIYICVTISINTRMIVGYTISKKNNSQVAIETIEKAINKYGVPTMISSDRGSPFVSKTYHDTLKEYKITQSMSRPRKAVDNRYIETLFNSMKTEIGKTKHLKMDEYIRIVEYWIYYYNTQRLHSSIGYITPLSKYVKTQYSEEEKYDQIKKILTESEFVELNSKWGNKLSLKIWKNSLNLCTTFRL